MEGLLIAVLVLMLILVLVHFLADALPGVAPYKNILMIVVLIIGIIYVLRSSALI